MKQIILVIFLIFTFNSLNAQNINFKDSNFKNALFENKIKIDLNNDGIIQVDSLGLLNPSLRVARERYSQC